MAASETVCAATATALGLTPGQILPSSIGVIGWSMPVAAMVGAVPAAITTLQAGSILPAAEGICTTDLYPKIRRVDLAGGSIVGIAKGAGMIEPNLATPLAAPRTERRDHRRTGHGPRRSPGPRGRPDPRVHQRERGLSQLNDTSRSGFDFQVGQGRSVTLEHRPRW